jgi:hypothetical protein
MAGMLTSGLYENEVPFWFENESSWLSVHCPVDPRQRLAVKLPSAITATTRTFASASEEEVRACRRVPLTWAKGRTRDVLGSVA